MSYLIVSVIHSCILHLMMKKESICIWYPCSPALISKWYFHKWSLKVFSNAIQKCLSRKGWVPKAMNQYILDTGEEKKKQAKLLPLVSHYPATINLLFFFFLSWQGFTDVFLTTIKQKYSIWKQKNVYIASNNLSNLQLLPLTLLFLSVSTCKLLSAYKSGG